MQWQRLHSKCRPTPSVRRPSAQDDTHAAEHYRHRPPGSQALTGLGRDAVYAAIRDGHLVARKAGRRTLITDDDLRQFLAELPRAGGYEQASAVSAQ